MFELTKHREIPVSLARYMKQPGAEGMASRDLPLVRGETILVQRVGCSEHVYTKGYHYSLFIAGTTGASMQLFETAPLALAAAADAVQPW